MTPSETKISDSALPEVKQDNNGVTEQIEEALMALSQAMAALNYQNLVDPVDFIRHWSEA